MTVHPSTYEVVVTFLQDQSGTVDLFAPSAVAVPFTSETAITVTNGTHGLGTAHLFAQIVNAATPAALVVPGSVTVDPSTFAVVVTFGQPQSGVVLLAAPGDRQAWSFSQSTGAETVLLGLGSGASTAAQIASSLHAGTATVADTSARVASSLRSVAAALHSVEAHVTSSLRAVTATVQAATAVLASSVRPGSGTLSGTAQAVASSLRAASASLQSAEAHTTSSVRAGSAAMPGTSTRVASSLRAAAGTASAQSQQTNSQIRSGTAATQGLSSRVASSVQSVAGVVQALDAHVASSLRSQTATTTAGTQLLAFSLQTGTGTIDGTAAVVSGQVRSASSALNASSSRIASSLRDGTGHTIAGVGATVSSSLRSGQGSLQASADLSTAAPVRNFGQSFTAATSVTIPASVHGYTTNGLLVQVYDASSPIAQQILPGTIAVHQTTHEVTLTFAQPQSGRVVINGTKPASGAHANISAPFTNQTSFTVSGSTHGFGHADLLVQVYSATNPAQVLPGTVRVHQSTYDVTVVFAQPQSGTVIIGGYGPRGVQPSVGTAFTNETVFVVTGTEHGLGSNALLAQVYDAASPVAHRVLPATLSVHATNFNVTLTFAQPQSGTVYLNGGTTTSISMHGTGQVQDAAAVLASSVRAGTAQATASAGLVIRPPTNVAVSFTEQTTVVIPQSTHGFAHPALLVQAWDTQTPRHHLRPGSVTIHPTTHTVTVTFLDPQSGTIVLNGARSDAPGQANVLTPFTNQSTVTILGTAHGLATPALLVETYNTATPRLRLSPASVTVHPTTYDVVVTFADAQSGVVLLNGYGAPGDPPNLATVFTNQSTVTIPGTTHNLSTSAIFTAVYDTQTPRRRLVPGSVTVHPTTLNVVVTFLDAQSGTVVLSASVPATMAGVGSMAAQVTGLLTTSLPPGAGQFVGSAAFQSHSLRAAQALLQVTDLVRVMSSVRAGSGQQQASSTRLVSSLLARVVSLQTTLRLGVSRSGSAYQQGQALTIAGAIHAGLAHLAALGTGETAVSRAGQVQIQATLTQVASSLRAASSQLQGSMALVLQNLRAAAAHLQGLTSVTVLTNSRLVGPVQMQAPASVIASNLRFQHAQMQAVCDALAHALLHRTPLIQALASVVTQSLRAGSARMQSQISQASGTPARAGWQAHSLLLTSSTRPASGVIQALSQALASSLASASGMAAGQSASHPSAQGLDATGDTQALALRLASSVLQAPAVIHAFEALLRNASRQATSQQQAQAGTLSLHSERLQQARMQGHGVPITGLEGHAHIQTGLTQFVLGVMQRPAVVQAVASFLQATFLAKQGQVQALSLTVVHDMVQRLLHEQAQVALITSEQGGEHAQTQTMVTMVASSLMGGSGAMQTAVGVVGARRRRLRAPLRANLRISRTKTTVEF